MEKYVVLYTEDDKSLDQGSFIPTNYETIADVYQEGLGNCGNKVHYTALEKFLIDHNVKYKKVYNEPLSNIDEKEVSAVIYQAANILGSHRIKLLSELAKNFSTCRVPIYVFGLGIQKSLSTPVKNIVKDIEQPALNFIKSVYNSGGEIACRGYQTKEFLDLIMPSNTAVVTGCPSIYYAGPDFQIDNKKVSLEDFKPAINGHIKLLKQKSITEIFTTYKNAEYFCQDDFLNLLYNKKFFEEKVNVSELIEQFSLTGLKLIAEGRINLFYDIEVWKKYLSQNNFNFSFGSRIHGNVLPILAGIPALVYAIDSRIEEIADFYNIPYITELPSEKSLYQMYLDVDYTEFNESYPAKYKQFENFMVSHGLCEENSYDANLYTQFLKDIKYELPHKNKENANQVKTLIENYRYNFMNKIFSFSSDYRLNKKHKIMKIFGLKIKFKL